LSYCCYTVVTGARRGLQRNGGATTGERGGKVNSTHTHTHTHTHAHTQTHKHTHTYTHTHTHTHAHTHRGSAEAVAWWQRAAEGGDATAQAQVGVLAEEGGKPLLAHVWYGKAMAQGLPVTHTHTHIYTLTHTHTHTHTYTHTHS
jgi:TPR repeat protein